MGHEAICLALFFGCNASRSLSQRNQNGGGGHSILPKARIVVYKERALPLDSLSPALLS